MSVWISCSAAKGWLGTHLGGLLLGMRKGNDGNKLITNAEEKDKVLFG
jgi:hypothetical protein